MIKMEGGERALIVIVCVDDKNGVAFNRRRQSKDRILQEHILNMVGSSKLWMSPYSRKQFADTREVHVIVDEECLEKAGDSDYCFAEDKDSSQYVEKIDTLILFKWNRVYPADTYFTLDTGNYTLEQSEDFAGYSHEKITKEIYKMKKAGR